MNNLYNFMFFTGYFKKISERIEDETRDLEIAIPNKEIKYIFREKVLKWFNDKIKAEDLSKVYTSVLKGDVETFQKEINRLLRKTISFNDAYENFYHGFVVGVLSGMDGYIVKSNREAGDGRSDIYIRPLSIFQRAVIIEIKVCDKPKEISNYISCIKDLAITADSLTNAGDEVTITNGDQIVKFKLLKVISHFFKKVIGVSLLNIRRSLFTYRNFITIL